MMSKTFIQTETNKRRGCQVDYLIQTKYKTLYLIEIKFSKNTISTKVIHDVSDKMDRLVIPRGYACLPVLIHINGVTDTVRDQGFFHKIIDFSEYLADYT